MFIIWQEGGSVVSGMSVSGVSPSVPAQGAAPVQEERKALTDALKEQEEEQKTLVEMMQEAKEKADKRKEQLKLPKNSQRYGDAAILAYSKLARARSLGEVDAASGYARRQIAQLRAAKRSDSESAERIQAAINQLQKAVNRAGRKKRELSQEKLSAKRQAKLEKEKRKREASRLRHQLRSRQAMRMIRESGYLREADVDNRLQDQLQASRVEMRQQMADLSAGQQTAVDAAVRQYAAASAQPSPAPEISVEA